MSNPTVKRMAMKVKRPVEEDSDPGALPGRTIPFGKKALSKLFTDQFDRMLNQPLVEAVSKYLGQPLPVEQEPPPPSNNIIMFPSRPVEAANDSDGGVKRRKKGGGGGGKCQDECPELKAWLAAFCTIPNNVWWLKDKDRHIEANERSKKVRLIKFGDADYQPPRPPDWKVMHEVPGWWGSRPPSPIDLVKNSRKIASKLGTYKADMETIAFVKSNMGRVVFAPKVNDPCCIVMQCAESIEAYDRYLECTFDMFIEGDRQLLISPRFLSEMTDPTTEEPSEGLPLLLSPSREISPVIRNKQGLPSGCPAVVLYKNSFELERKRQARRLIHADNPVSYSALRHDTVRQSVQPTSNVDDELAYYLSHAMAAPEPEIEPVSSINARDPDQIRLNRWYHQAQRRSVSYNDLKYRRNPSFFEVKVPKNDQKWCYENWLLHRMWLNGPDWNLSREEKYWERLKHRDDSARLASWFIERPGPSPEVKVRKSVLTAGDKRWNTYVMHFNQYVKGKITKDELSRKARAIWDYHWKQPTQSERVIEGEVTTWAELQDECNNPATPDWIIDPAEINRINQQGVEKIAEHYLCLKRAYHNLGQHLKKVEKQLQPHASAM